MSPCCCDHQVERLNGPLSVPVGRARSHTRSSGPAGPSTGSLNGDGPSVSRLLIDKNIFWFEGPKTIVFFLLGVVPTHLLVHDVQQPLVPLMNTR